MCKKLENKRKLQLCKISLKLKKVEIFLNSAIQARNKNTIIYVVEMDDGAA